MLVQFQVLIAFAFAIFVRMQPVLSRLSANRATLFICDLQERFRPVIHRFDSVIKKSSFLVQCATTLDIPVLITEQKPKALGNTVVEIKTVLDSTRSHIFEKTMFSMMTPEVQAHFKTTGRDQVILCGIESHVCVLQTALDLVH